MHAHGVKSEAEILNILKLPWDTWATDLLVCKRTPRTGTFHQTWVTEGDTACCVKGVLHNFTSAMEVVSSWVSVLTRFNRRKPATLIYI